MISEPTTRRSFLAGTAMVSAGLAIGSTPSQAAPGGGSAFTYEVTRSNEEWRALLTESDYQILREGGTEWPRSSPYWDSEEIGTYCCKGCDLPLYESTHKVVLSIGWVFFRHSLPDAVLTSIDLANPDAGNMGMPDEVGGLEVHCRRCGSHQGHIVSLEGGPMHCINGAALNFAPA